MTAKSLSVTISSTARDLPEHRKEVLDACLRQGMFPRMMEHLPASDAEAIGKSLEMVDAADIYVGIFAHRYGYVPRGHAVSVTEMEYNRAVERKMKRLIFMMHEDHPIKAADVEKGEGAIKLESFKARVQTENIVNFFKSPADLRAHVTNSLSYYREADLTAFHYVSNIPQPPEAYVAHPYTLLQTHRLVGRQAELNLLTDWVTNAKTFRVSKTLKVSIMNIVAIGGMGKSALTWTWFNDIAPQEMNPLAGRMWWRFYESDATFENFVIRALAYVTLRSREEVQQISPPDREAQLLTVLDRELFLLVLDGLERILLAYARMDAARLDDSQVGSQKNLRKTTDPRVGSFLKKLAQVRHSRILVSSRLYPTELETQTGRPIPGSFRHNIGGLTDQDAVELWRAVGITGSRDELLPIFTRFDKHPLLIQALAGEVKSYRRAPGNLAAWRQANPTFDPTRYRRLQDAMGHVLEFALRGLEAKARQVLQTLAAFRMPASYDTLAALFVSSPLGEDQGEGEGEEKLFPTEPGLDEVLKELEDRGLVGWDRRANRYDLHPIVRGVVWSGLRAETRNDVLASLEVHFDAVPKIDDYRQVNSLQDLTPAIELYNTLVGLGRYDDAYVVFKDRISLATLYRLSASSQRAELLELLFPDGVDQLPRLSQPSRQAYTFGALGQSYRFSGQPGRAAPLISLDIEIRIREGDKNNASVALRSLSDALRQAGALQESEAAARSALIIVREQKSRRIKETNSLYMLGLALAAQGREQECATALDRSVNISLQADAYEPYDYQAQRALWFGHWRKAEEWANKAEDYCRHIRYERGMIRAARLQAQATLGLDNFANADERLHHALMRARAVNLVEEELPALVALAELRRQGNPQAGRERLEEVWKLAERGPYPLVQADAFNVLAQIERDGGNSAAAVEAASQAYRLAWCDGPPFAYHWGLEAARQHLAELGAPEPSLPPFDESNYEPMPEVEIDPEDEFHVGSD